jgi:hypothetical protein
MYGIQQNLLQNGIVGSLVSMAALASSLVVGISFGRAPERAGGGEEFRLGEPVTYENLTVFPVVTSRSADTSAFLTLDEALASGDAVVTEQGGDIMRRSRDARPVPFTEQGGAQVNQLVLLNRGSKPLLLLAGEIVSGGKQDRIIGKDRIVPVGAAPLPLDVFCVEHGRWTTASPKFSAGHMMVHPSVREKAAVDQSQGRVWAAVRGGTTAARPSGTATGSAPALDPSVMGDVIASQAPSESYRKIYESPQIGGSVENFAAEVERRFARSTANLKGERVVGVVVAYGGEVAWSDLFASPELFGRYWKKLLRSYVVEALARPGTHEHATLEDAGAFLNRAGGHERTESEPGAYVWKERTDGRYAEIELEALVPKPMTLHWLKVLRTS